MLLEDRDIVFVRLTDDEKTEFMAEVARRVDAKLAMEKVTVERRVQRPRSRMAYLKPEHLPHLYGYAPASDSEDDLKDEQVEQKPEDVNPENELAPHALPTPPLPAKSTGKSKSVPAAAGPPNTKQHDPEIPKENRRGRKRDTETKEPVQSDNDNAEDGNTEHSRPILRRQSRNRRADNETLVQTQEKTVQANQPKSILKPARTATSGLSKQSQRKTEAPNDDGDSNKKRSDKNAKSNIENLGKNMENKQPTVNVSFDVPPKALSPPAKPKSILKKTQAAPPTLPKRDHRSTGTSGITIVKASPSLARSRRTEGNRHEDFESQLTDRAEASDSRRLSVLALKPPKIELPSPAVSDLRRSNRTKMPPVKDWAGQRVIYKNDKDGLPSFAGVSTPKIDSRRRSQYTADLKYKEASPESDSD
ncbi:hypothetical protein Ddc_00062 [Ditylenchus destructor]|nr:hypothetical protein Ddc_00062 [Ditylenchus destructor]